jgi:glycerol uptake facilitator-like aquaporin
MNDSPGQRVVDIATVRATHPTANSEPAASPMQALAAELLGTAALLATVVGSGIMGQQLSGGNDGIALLANAAATAAALYVLIALFGPVSGAHFNPAVTLALRMRRQELPAAWWLYVLVQIVGAICGVLLAHAMFAQPLWQPGVHARTGAAQWLSEGVATFGLLLTILLGSRLRPQAVPALVASYIFAAYWFTASTSFANPAVTLARALTRSFAGIRPQDTLGFIGAQLCGALLATWIASLVLQRGAVRR